ncbi:stage II sporulation protein R [Harryflintia acetispora]|uniref:stage II sporulation protein R n=1 Tax=Harryflintia acetispora TaxID=1849041 RepID=UPI00189B5466|nr:stage II sporulation protein R [Harryflintia acetispora]
MFGLKKIEISLLGGLLLAILLSSIAAFAAQSDRLQGQVLRLHILANSDEAFDQQIKLEVRDAILRELGEELSQSRDRDEAEHTAQMLLPRAEEIARRVIQGNGYDYPVQAKLINMHFETRSYGTITMPAGDYDAVRITIGEAQGHNWWCVLYPPICVPAAADIEDLAQLESDPVASGNPQYEPRFKILEILEGLKKNRELSA